MTVRTALQNWLQGPHRSYGEGLALFNLLADTQARQKYQAFFSEVSDCLSGDIHYQMLADKLARISRESRCNPSFMSVILEQVFPYQSYPASSPVPSKSASPQPSGLHVSTSYDDLPSDLKPVYDEIRSITPLYAKLHSELSAAADDSSRKELAERLCELDDRRRKLWDRLDAWADGRPYEISDSEPVVKPSYSEDSVLCGLQLAQRKKRLLDNIRTSKMSITRFEKSGKTEQLAKARRRLSAYEEELDNLLRTIADAEA